MTAAELHARLVDHLVERGLINSPAVEAAFRAVPRHLFLPDVQLERVYRDEAIPTRHDAAGVPTSSSSQPGIMAAMLEQLEVQPGQRALEIGTGTAYNAALLAELVGTGGEVVTIDVDEALVGTARERLVRSGYSRVRVVTGDGWLGVAEHAPYDRLEATVGVWDISPQWVEQLVDEGIVVMPLVLRGFQAVVAFRKFGRRLRSCSVVYGGFMLLRSAAAGDPPQLRSGEWTASTDGLRREQVEALGEVLRQAPRFQSSRSQEILFRLALTEPNAVVAFRSAPGGPGGMFGVGIFDEREGSLVMVNPAPLLVFGKDAAKDRLLQRLEGLRPLEWRALRIEAVPAGDDVREGAIALLDRAYHRFAVYEEPSG